MHMYTNNDDNETSTQSTYTNPNLGVCSACGYPINCTPFYDNVDLCSNIKATVACTNSMCINNSSEVVGDTPPAWVD